MILAAGLGTRLKPLTDSVPKALVKIFDKTLLEYTIHYLKKSGVDEIIINVHHFSEQITDFLNTNKNFEIRIEISDESDKLLGIGGGLKKASWFFNDGKPFILIGIDVITSLNIEEMYKYHTENSPLVTLAVKSRPTSRNLLFDSQYNLCGWKNNETGEIKKISESEAQHSLAFSVVHIINPKIFEYIVEEGVFGIMDVYLRLARQFTIKGFRHDESYWYEFGRVEKIKASEEDIELRKILEQHIKKYPKTTGI